MAAVERADAIRGGGLALAALASRRCGTRNDFLTVLAGLGAVPAIPFLNARTVALAILAATLGIAGWVWGGMTAAHRGQRRRSPAVAWLLPFEVGPAFAVTGWAGLATGGFGLVHRVPATRMLAGLPSVALMVVGGLVAITVVAPPTRLIVDAATPVLGLLILTETTIALVALAVACAVGARLQLGERLSPSGSIAAGVLLVYAASMGVVDVFQAQVGTRPLEDLRREAQLALSLLWSGLGGLAFAIGLRTSIAASPPGRSSPARTRYGEGLPRRPRGPRCRVPRHVTGRPGRAPARQCVRLCPSGTTGEAGRNRALTPTTSRPASKACGSGYTRRRWTSTSSGRWPRPPSVRRWTRSWTGRVGLARRRPRPDGRGPRRPRRARGAVAPRPADPGAPRGPGADRLDQPAGAELRLPAAERSAGRGVRRRDVLRAVLDDAAAADRGPRLRRHRLPPGRRGGRRGGPRARRSVRPGRRPRTGRRPGCGRRVSGCASGRPRRCSRSPGRAADRGRRAGRCGRGRRRLRQRSGSMPRTASAPSRTVRRRWRTGVPPGRRAGPPAPRPRRRRRPDVARRLPAPRRLPGARRARARSAAAR